MTVTLHFSPDVEAGIAAQAKARGLTVDRYVETVIEQAVSGTDAQPACPAKTWVDGDIPVFSASRPMAVEMIEETIEAVRAERIAVLSGLA